MHRTGEGGEEPWVTIKNKQEPTSFTHLILNEEKDGMELMKVEKLDNPKETTATVKKDGQIATLKRDEAAWTSMATVLNPGASRAEDLRYACRPGNQLVRRPIPQTPFRCRARSPRRLTALSKPRRLPARQLSLRSLRLYLPHRRPARASGSVFGD